MPKSFISAYAHFGTFSSTSVTYLVFNWLRTQVGVDTRNLSPNLMWQMSPCDRICMKLMCPRNDLGSAAFLFRDIVVRCVEKSILSACLGGSRLAAAIRQVAKAGYLGGPAALRGGSELRGIGPSVSWWRRCGSSDIDLAPLL